MVSFFSFPALLNVVNVKNHGVPLHGSDTNIVNIFNHSLKLRF